MNAPDTELDRGSAGHLKLSRAAIDRIVEATTGHAHSAVRCAVDKSSADALFQFVFNLLVIDSFGSRPSAKQLEPIKRAIFKIHESKDKIEKGEREIHLRRKLSKLSCVDYPPPSPDPPDLARLCRWLDTEQEARRGGGRPPNDWAAQADIKLLAAYELIFGRAASSGLDGPTMRFLLSFFEQGHKELTRSDFRFAEERSQLLGLWSCGNGETLRTRLRNALRAREKQSDPLPGLPLAEGTHDQIAAYKTMFKALVWGDTESPVTNYSPCQ